MSGGTNPRNGKQLSMDSANVRRRRRELFRAVARASFPDDMVFAGDGYVLAKDVGLTVVYCQTPYTSKSFPLEVSIYIGFVDGLKSWIIKIPDLGFSTTIPYSTEESEEPADQ